MDGFGPGRLHAQDCLQRRLGYRAPEFLRQQSYWRRCQRRRPHRHAGNALGDFLVRISATQLMSSKEFARTHGVTKTSGYVAVPAFEGHDGDQAAGGLTAQNAPDVVRLTFPPPPSAPGVEFPAADAATIAPAAAGDAPSEQHYGDHGRHGRCDDRGGRHRQRHPGCAGCQRRS